jgi:hypothetical protein
MGDKTTIGRNWLDLSGLDGAEVAQCLGWCQHGILVCVGLAVNVLVGAPDACYHIDPCELFDVFVGLCRTLNKRLQTRPFGFQYIDPVRPEKHPWEQNGHLVVVGVRIHKIAQTGINTKIEILIPVQMDGPIETVAFCVGDGIRHVINFF